MWTAIVVTCPFKSWCNSLETEIRKIVKLEGFQTENILVVPDPGDEEGAGVGSGGATLNALLVATEHLSARAGHTTVVADLLFTSRILVIHLGPATLPLPTGLLYIPDHDSAIPTTNLARTIKIATKLVGDKVGVLVASTDILLEGDIQMEDVHLAGDIVLPTVRSAPDYAVKHGVVMTSKDGSVSNILYQPSMDELSETVDIISGLVWFSANVAESLIKLYSLSPIDGCTYMGADSGEDSLQMSLYYDILPAACSGVTRAEFEQGKCGKTLRRGRSSSQLMLTARKEVWNELRRYRIWNLQLSGVNHKYLNIWNSFDGSELMEQWRKMKSLLHHENVISSSKDDKILIDSNCQSISYSLMYNCGINNCQSVEDPKVETKCHLVNICYPTLDFGYVNVVLAETDDLHKNFKDEGATYLGMTWDEVFEKLNFSEEDVWGTLSPCLKTLSNARLFNGHSINEIRHNLDLRKSFEWRAFLHKDIFCKSLESNSQFSFHCRYYDAMELAVVEDWDKDLLHVLDNIALDHAKIEAGSKRTSKMASVLAMTADLLGCMAGNMGGLRSGPSHNKDFKLSFQLLESGKILEGVEELIRSRNLWLDRPTRIIRAARHYEGVVQMFIRHTVLSARDNIKVDTCPSHVSLPEIGVAVVATCPARLDLSGGWTDTPPVCYEMGGKVVDLAIKVDDKKPIGCKVIRKHELCISIMLDNGNKVEVVSIKDLEDYCNPSSPGALIKCCLLASKIVSIDGPKLEDQLSKICGGGLDIYLWSDLPQGSGLGTSSILAGCCLASCWSAVSLSYTRSDLVHAVLVVEQLLTTGGGWQDQVGGLHPGLNLGTSEATDQVYVATRPAQVSSDMIQQLDTRLILMFSGKPRLAKNLLQNVIRNWYSQDKTIVECFQSNFKLAEKCWTHVLDEDIEGVGECLSEYWKIKRTLAPGSEPQLVRNILDALQPLIVGGGLAGAGGGGFLAAILKDGVSKDDAINVVRKLPGTERLTYHKATVDCKGLEVHIGDHEVYVPF